MAAFGQCTGGAGWTTKPTEPVASSNASDALRRSQDQQYLDQPRYRAVRSPDCEVADPFVAAGAAAFHPATVDSAQRGGGGCTSRASAAGWSAQGCAPYPHSQQQCHYQQQQQHYSRQYDNHQQQQQRRWDGACGGQMPGAAAGQRPEQPPLPDSLRGAIAPPAIGTCDASEEKEYTHEGWFRKCRGCGAMTVHELMVESARVPFCMRCKARTAEMVAARRDDGLWQSLLYVHNAWAAAGV